MKENIQDEIIGSVKNALKESGLVDSFAEELYLDIPADARFGDFSTNVAMRLSKSLKKNPRDVASDLIEKIKKQVELSSLKAILKRLRSRELAL